ncbi:hypothetical protein [Shimia sp. MMG029]|uniref:hypothetical protein n=1 Tax=Shimia sp. MMG029 TaxID=3021978 RepID=UPI0022FE8DA2|nr:hypothetical protein [Shimia sp. MMG029]MDA5557335.1 hypothetical protein [Shimia sp. MMG029]
MKQDVTGVIGTEELAEQIAAFEAMEHSGQAQKRCAVSVDKVTRPVNTFEAYQP